jgi:hypothetical protein
MNEIEWKIQGKSPYSDSHLIFDKAAEKSMLMKIQPLQQMVLRKLHIHM